MEVTRVTRDRVYEPTVFTAFASFLVARGAARPSQARPSRPSAWLPL